MEKALIVNDGHVENYVEKKIENSKFWAKNHVIFILPEVGSRELNSSTTKTCSSAKVNIVTRADKHVVELYPHQCDNGIHSILAIVIRHWPGVTSQMQGDKPIITQAEAEIPTYI